MVYALLLLLLAHSAHSLLSVNNALGSSMVLQRAPAHAQIWGRTDTLQQVNLTLSNATADVFTVEARVSNGTWSAQLSPMPHGGPYSILIRAGTEQLRLDDVLFGEVMLCSGQSNMVFSLGQTYDNASHVAAADLPQYRSIRLFTATPSSSHTPLDFLPGVEQSWTQTSSAAVGNPKPFSYFSAACWFAGKAVIDQQVYGVGMPLGLMVSAYGGTRVHQWSSGDALKQCNQSTGLRSGDDSVHWNAMIAPLLPMQFGNLLWLQGESDVNPSDDPHSIQPQRGATYYACAIQAMLSDWRRKFSQPLPFSFVQIAPWVGHEAATSDLQLPALRQAQLAALALPASCVASAVDLGDFDPSTNPWGGVHFRNKSPLGPRLALCIAHLHGQHTAPYRAPSAASGSVDGASGVRVTFESSGAAELVSNNTLVCPFGAGTPLAQKCGGFELELNGSSWVPAEGTVTGPATVQVKLAGAVSSSGAYTGVRYLFADWPVALIFGKAEGSGVQLPVLPFVLTSLKTAK